MLCIFLGFDRLLFLVYPILVKDVEIGSTTVDEPTQLSTTVEHLEFHCDVLLSSPLLICVALFVKQLPELCSRDSSLTVKEIFGVAE